MATQQSPGVPGSAKPTGGVPGVTKPATTGETVTIALKHPHGLILRLHKMVEEHESTPLGFRSMKIARCTGQSVTLRGYSERRSAVPPAATAGAFAFTYGVPKDFWEEWLKQNAEHPYVKEGLIFAASDNKAADQASERKELRSGLEPLNPEKLPLAKIQTYKAE